MQQACNTVIQACLCMKCVMYNTGKVRVAAPPTFPILQGHTLASVGSSSPSTPYFLLSSDKNASKMTHVHKYTSGIYGIPTELTCTFNHPGAYFEHTYLPLLYYLHTLHTFHTLTFLTPLLCYATTHILLTPYLTNYLLLTTNLLHTTTTYYYPTLIAPSSHPHRTVFPPSTHHIPTHHRSYYSIP
jgi:hypothetical protein